MSSTNQPIASGDFLSFGDAKDPNTPQQSYGNKQKFNPYNRNQNNQNNSYNRFRNNRGQGGGNGSGGGGGGGGNFSPHNFSSPNNKSNFRGFNKQHNNYRGGGGGGRNNRFQHQNNFGNRNRSMHGQVWKPSFMKKIAILKFRIILTNSL